MKTNVTRLKILFQALSFLVIISIKGFGQPDYVFKNCSLESGLNKQVGAIYRFPSVKTDIDALVLISNMSTDVKIVDFDDNANGGFDEAFQPRIQAKGKTNGYAEFVITFVKSGTNIPVVMTEVPATSIDVDGNRSATDSMFEFDEYMTPGAYQLDYDMVSTDLRFNYTGASVIGKNKRGMEKAAIDTVAMEAMFSVIYPNTNSITIRIGLDNQLNGSTTRQRSVYFRRFFFQNSFLPVYSLFAFSGNRNTKNEIVLTWKMSSLHDYVTTSVEKSLNGTSFSPIGQVQVTGKSSASFTDNTKTTSGAYYRLKTKDNNGKIIYSSVLFIKPGDIVSNMTVYPSIVHDNTNISFPFDNNGSAKISLFDMSGKLLMKKDMLAQTGNNTIALTGLSQFNTGQYLLVVSKDGRNYTQKIQRLN